MFPFVKGERQQIGVTAFEKDDIIKVRISVHYEGPLKIRDQHCDDTIKGDKYCGKHRLNQSGHTLTLTSKLKVYYIFVLASAAHRLKKVYFLISTEKDLGGKKLGIDSG